MSDTTNLFTMARSKLHVSISGRDTCSLHRWVLLKNSIISSPSTRAPVSDMSSPEDSDTDSDDLVEVDSDSFLFPDAGKLVTTPSPDDALINTSEAQWLDSLLETLGDDDEDDDFAPDAHHTVSIIPVDEDDDQLLISPMGSPLSSSDDLPSHHHHSASSACYPPPITVSYSYPYPVPYPPFHPPLIHPYEFDSPSLAAIAYDQALPYHDSDAEENLSVPDAIEDTSDDESDAPLTPSIGRSTASSLTLPSPLTGEHSALRHVGLGLAMGTGRPRVHYDLDDPYFYPFDPLPYPEPNHPYNSYQEC